MSSLLIQNQETGAELCLMSPMAKTMELSRESSKKHNLLHFITKYRLLSRYFNCEPHKGVFVSLRSGKCRLAQTARPNTRHAWGGGELEDLPVIKPKVKRPNRITVQSIPLTEMLPESKEFVLTNKPDVKISNDLYNEMKINENDNNYAEYSVCVSNC